MTDRQNHRAPRDGRSERRDSDRAMQIWAWWWVERRERGWPSESPEARILAHGGELVRATTPAGPRVPDIDKARHGPRVNRLLQDMDAEGLAIEALVLRLVALSRRGYADVAAELEISTRTVLRRHRRGRDWMDEQLRLIPLEVRQGCTGDQAC